MRCLDGLGDGTKAVDRSHLAWGEISKGEGDARILEEDESDGKEAARRQDEVMWMRFGIRVSPEIRDFKIIIKRKGKSERRTHRPPQLELKSV